MWYVTLGMVLYFSCFGSPYPWPTDAGQYAKTSVQAREIFKALLKWVRAAFKLAPLTSEMYKELLKTNGLHDVNQRCMSAQMAGVACTGRYDPAERAGVRECMRKDEKLEYDHTAPKAG